MYQRMAKNIGENVFVLNGCQLITVFLSVYHKLCRNNKILWPSNVLVLNHLQLAFNYSKICTKFSSFEKHFSKCKKRFYHKNSVEFVYVSTVAFKC